MQTDSPAKLTSRSRAILFAVRMLVVIGCGWFLYTRPGSFDTGSQCIGLFAFVIAMFSEFAVKRGYLKVRSQDSWLRIIGVTLFAIAAGVLVSAVGIYIVLKLK